MNQLSILIVLGLIFIVSSCEQIQKATDVVTNPTAREIYERSFKQNDSLLVAWNRAFEQSKRDSVLVSLPYAESGVFNPEHLYVYSYDVQLREGETLLVSVSKQPDSTNIFIELFEKTERDSAPLKLLKASEPDSSYLSYTIETYGVYKITIQPEMNRSVPFQLKMYTQPTYTFPVSGAGNNDVQSLWAASRDGGNRSHEGIDIFAPKGTPLVAVTKGRIVSTKNQGRGGKQIWLRDGLFGKTIYYAHLDSIAIREGQAVSKGDTIGYVGNTGNAETTEPHLHFGIYKGNSGPVNPFPYVKQTEIPEITIQNKVRAGVSTYNNTVIYQGPSSAMQMLGKVATSDTVSILGKHGIWYHVVAKNGVKGFVQEASIHPLLSN